MTALQIAIDYLDSLGEAPVDDPLADGLALHRAIDDAVSPDTPTGDWYRHHPQREDGGYLAALVAACREEIAGLPASGVGDAGPDAGGEALRRRPEPHPCRGPDGRRRARGVGPRATGGPRLPLVGGRGGCQLLRGGPRPARRGGRSKDDGGRVGA